MKFPILLTICTCAWAQTGVVQPQLGKMLDPNGAVRTVYGIAASVTLGAAEITGVLSSGCSNTFCLAKTDANIVSASGAVPAPAGPAMFAFDGAAAFLWFPESRQLAQWQNRGLAFIPASIDGEVLSIGANAGAVQFAVRTRSGIWIMNLDGSVASSLPRTTGPVLLIPGGVIYATDSEIVVGNVQFPLAGVTAFSQMSSRYVQVRAGGIDYALRIQQGREVLFQLPALAGVSP
jgi:hypothetical protein